MKKCVPPAIGLLLLSVSYGAYISQFKSTLAINWNNLVSKIFFVLAILLTFYGIKMIFIAVVSWYARKVAVKTASQLDDEFIPLIKKIAAVIIWAIAVIAILSYLGVNINAMITTLGVGSLAIALAAQDTFANIIAGFLIMVDRPFRIGDQIKLPSGELVTVLSIGNRRSKFRAEDGSLIIVPNLDLSKSKIVNLSRTKKS